MRRVWRAALVGALASIPLTVAAKTATAQSPLSGSFEVTTDERRRGLSWSEGKGSASADVSLDMGDWRASSRVVGLRRSPRHGGADAVIDLTIANRRRLGAFEVELRGRGHLFAGGPDRLNYVEIGGGGSYALGPLMVDAGLDYAPSQSPIGGSTLYLYGGATAGIPGTPFTLVASAGRTTGTGTAARAARLRPDGRYHDWRIGVDHVTGPLTLGVDYIGTDLSRDDSASPYADTRHTGGRLLARARLAF